MTSRVADEVVATFARRQHDWMERVLKGSLDPENAARAVQAVVDRTPWFSTRGKSFLVPHPRKTLDGFKRREIFAFENQKWYLKVDDHLKRSVNLGHHPLSLGKYELSGQMTQKEMDSYFSEDSFFKTLEEAQVVIARLLRLQWVGKEGFREGFLSAHGCNYFPLPVKDTDPYDTVGAIKVRYAPNTDSGWLVSTRKRWGEKFGNGDFFFTK